MTQDPYGRPPGYVVRGEVVPDDEGNEAPPTAPMTHFQKVASALRGDRTDPAVPVQVPADQETGPQSPDPNGTWPRAATTTPDAPDAADSAEPDAASDVTRPEEVVAVRSPDAGNRDYWDDDETNPEQARAASPHEPAAETGPGPAAQDGATAEDGATVQDAAPAQDGAAVPDAVPAQDVAAQDVAASQDPTVTQPGLYATGARPEAVAAATEATGTRAGAPVQESAAAEEDAVAEEGAAAAPGAPVEGGLRPGESDRGLGDFSDLTYGSLLPDAAEFKTQWQQVQFRFVDDPQGSVTQAADVISQVTAKLEAAIAERQRAIAERQRTLRDRWSEGKSTDTESLRETLLMYRTFLDQLTGPK